MEDVVTTGGSALQAIAAARAAEVRALGVLAVVDRNEGDGNGSSWRVAGGLTTATELLG